MQWRQRPIYTRCRWLYDNRPDVCNNYGYRFYADTRRTAYPLKNQGHAIISKYLKPASIAAAFLVVVLLLHVVPVYNKTGSLDRGGANVCNGHTETELHQYRIVPNWVNGYRADKKNFKPGGSGSVCAKPITLRLYVL